MRYWVFVNNSVQGPFTIKEIIEKNYISPDLLVCPSEMSATKPSNWYFARELSEFDPYIDIKNKRKVNVLVEEIDEIKIENDGFDFKFNLEEKIVQPNFDEILDIERRKIEEKEKDEYRKKILSFERNIRDLDDKLKKALSSIEKYEKSLKEKDLVIEKLEKEIEELKKLREEDKKVFEEKIKEYQEILSSKKDEKDTRNSELKQIDNIDLKAESKISQDYDKNEFVETKSLNSDFEKVISTEPLAIKENAKIKDFEKDNSDNLNNISEKLEVNNEETELDPLSDNNISELNQNIAGTKDEPISIKEDLLKKQEEFSKDEEFRFNELNLEKREFNIPPEIDLLSLSNKVSEEKILDTYDKKQTEETSLKDINLEEKKDFEVKDEKNENFTQVLKNENENEQEAVYKKFEPVYIKITDSVSQESMLDKFEVNISSFSSVQPIEKDIPFQIADISLEKVETKLDVIPSSKIEPVAQNENIAAELEGKRDLSKEANIKIESLNELNKTTEEPTKDISFTSIALSREIDQDKLSALKINEKKLDFKDEHRKEEVLISEKKEEREERQENFSSSSQKLTISVKKSKTTKLIVLASFSIIFFFFALVYILRSGGDVDIDKSQGKGVYSQVSKQIDTQNFEKSQYSSNSSKEKQEEDLKISKINQNVQKAIDIVKNYNLGEGKGSIERWLSNSVTSSNGKEEWNATYLSGNLFVVQYRFLRFKSEPIVYLFEVDVEKNEIVRGINNNAINLLAGTKNEKKLDKAISKKFNKHIENDDEMF